MKKIVRIKLSSNNDLLNDGEMKRIRGGYSTGGGYRCNCKNVQVVNGYDKIISNEDTTCPSLDLECCTKLSSDYNQMACTEIK